MLQWKLRRLAARVLRVLERHAADDPRIAAFKSSLAPTAGAYIETYDALRKLGATLDRELAEGKHEVSLLASKMAAYASIVEATKAVEGFDRDDYDATGAVPDDTIADAHAFIDVVSGQLEAHPDSIPNGEMMIDDLRVTVEEAQKEWSEADAVKTQHRALVEQNRQNATKLSALLVAFRRTLGRTLGRAHPDYQTLRAAKVDREVLEEGEAEGLPAELVPSTETSEPNEPSYAATDAQSDLDAAE